MVELVFWPHLASWGLTWSADGRTDAGRAPDGRGRAQTEANGCREFDCEIGVLATFGLLGAVLGHLGPVLGFSWVILGLSWVILGLSWAILGLSWVVLLVILARLEHSRSRDGGKRLSRIRC